jgi:O-succinylbenzoic acid--CoA ligase
VTVQGHRRAAPGELVAVDLPPGELWLDVLADLWWRGVSVFPIDHRLTVREKRALVDIARPSVLVDADGDTVFPDVGVTDPHTAAVVVATSGTSGPPRLAELPRAALEGAIERANAAIEVPVDMPWLAVLTPAHVGGLLVYLRAAIFDTPVAAHERFEPGALSGGAPVCTSVVPTMVTRLVVADARLDDVTLVVGAAPLDRDTRGVVQVRGARVFQTYGMTETCGGAAYDGVPLADVEIRVSAEGLLEVRGPTLFSGYRHDPQATAEAFTIDGWFRTRDLGSVDDDGLVTVLGRADDAIRTGGETVWPAEVESVLRSHPAVADAAVAARPDPEWGQHVAAWIVPASSDAPPSFETLRAFCREHLARYKVPKEITVVATLPRTTTGKVKRHELG